MIVDLIGNRGWYQGLGADIACALDYISATEFSSMPDGRYEVRGDDIYATVQRYQTKPIEQGLWEAHRRYVDVQFIAAGTERIGYAPLHNLAILSPYDAAKDILFLGGSGEYINARAGTFLVLYPQDAHMPCLSSGAAGPVVKVVVKVAVHGVK